MKVVNEFIKVGRSVQGSSQGKLGTGMWNTAQVLSIESVETIEKFLPSHIHIAELQNSQLDHQGWILPWWGFLGAEDLKQSMGHS